MYLVSSLYIDLLLLKLKHFMSFLGSQAQPKAAPPKSYASAPAKKVVDINQPQTCKNQGCGQTFKEKDNHETACNYHPGPAVFHDRMRGVCTIYRIFTSSLLSYFLVLFLLITF
jgi:hypothetical protein